MSISKYKNVRTVVDGITFHSKKEAKRYQELKLLKVPGLQLQVRYPLKVNGVLVCTYVADFVYADKFGYQIVEDVKGVKTEAYKLKKKLMLALHEIDIKET